MPYIGGFPVYVQKCNEVMNNAYEGFVLKGTRANNAPPQVNFTERWQVPLDIEVISPRSAYPSFEPSAHSTQQREQR
jgi:cyclohexanone monooxygenase